MSNTANKVCGVNVSGFGPMPVGDGDSSFKESGKKREAVIACNPADTAPVESNVLAELEFSLVVKKSTDLQAIGALEDVLVTVTMSNGKKFYMHRAWAEEVPSLGSDGKAKVKFLSAKSTPAN